METVNDKSSRLMFTDDEIKPGYDHRLTRVNGTVIGFKALDSDKIQLQRCFECKRENYILSVSSGICCWCGWDANEATQVDCD